MSGYLNGMPGYKGAPPNPGSDAAHAYGAEKLARRQGQVLAGLRVGPAGATRIGERIGLHWQVVRARLTELEKLGFAIKTGLREPTTLGSLEGQYRLATEDERHQFNARKAVEDEKGERAHG